MKNMLYKKNVEKSLKKELFKNPTSEFRGTPFWALNSYRTKEELYRQIDVFKEMGLGGFHLHVRTGLENEYLSEEYMELVKDTVVKAKTENGKFTVTTSDYMGALIEVSVDGEIKGDIIYPPYTLEIKGVPNGEHEIGLKLYTHRFNSFGPLHLVNVNEKWIGPDAWRTEGINWSYEYVLRTTGILKAPGIS